MICSDTRVSLVVREGFLGSFHYQKRTFTVLSFKKELAFQFCSVFVISPAIILPKKKREKRFFFFILKKGAANILWCPECFLIITFANTLANGYLTSCSHEAKIALWTPVVYAYILSLFSAFLVFICVGKTGNFRSQTLHSSRKSIADRTAKKFRSGTPLLSKKVAKSFYDSLATKLYS